MTERVYFCHGYKPWDRRFNEYFWGKLRGRVDSWIDPGLTEGFSGEPLPMDVTFNEWMMSRCSGFVGVVAHRDSPSGQLAYSPYQQFEYRLATRYNMPKLVFIEEGLRLQRFGEDSWVEYPVPWLRFFGDEFQKTVQHAVDQFVAAVERYAHEQRQPAFSGRWHSPSLKGIFRVGILNPIATGDSSAWPELLLRLRKTFRDPDGVRFELLSPLDVEHEFQLREKLQSYDLVVVDVGPQGTPSEVIGYLQHTGIPMLRLCHSKAAKERKQLARFLDYAGEQIRGLLDAGAPLGLPRMLDGYRLDEQMRPVGFWKNVDEMAQATIPTIRRIIRFDSGAKHRLETHKDAREYFARRYPQPVSGRIFLSFAGQGDSVKVTTRLADILRFLGFSCFHYLGEMIPGGQLDTGDNIPDALQLRVEESDVVVAFLDKAYFASSNCMGELAQAVALHGRDLELLAYNPNRLPLPAVLKDQAVSPGVTQQDDCEGSGALERIVDEIERAARRAREPLAEQVTQLRDWLNPKSALTSKELSERLTEQDVSETEALNWAAKFQGRGVDVIAEMVRVPDERSARQRHRELLTLLLLGLAEREPKRQIEVERWLRRNRWLVWPPESPSELECQLDLPVTAVSLTERDNRSEVGQSLYRSQPRLLGSAAPLCVRTDPAGLLRVPLEWAREGDQAEPLGVRRAIRWKLLGTHSVRASLSEARRVQQLPPTVLLIQTGSDLLGPSAEVRQLDIQLRNEFHRLGWPRERVRNVEVRSKTELLGLLREVRHDVIHIAGHMGPDEVQVGRIVVTGTELCGALRSSGARMLMLNGCEAAKLRAPLAAGGLALVDRAVMFGRVPEVVAHRFAIGDEDARLFALAFYDELFKTFDVARSVLAARLAGSPDLNLSPVAISQRA